MAEIIGLMEGAFFVSRNELLNWINDLLKLNVTKIEQLGTGAVYCQILDACYPNEVALQKVNWRARLDWEFVNNFKVLQQAFDKLGIAKMIEVEKLVKARYQDNLEFAQWMKGFFENKFGKNEIFYDALARRGKVEPDFSFLDKTIPTKALLNYQNPIYFAGDSKRSKAKDELSHLITKKVKITTNSKEKENHDSNLSNIVEATEKYRKERDNLQAKLNQIESIVMAPNVEDQVILKNIREFLGFIVEKTPIMSTKEPQEDQEEFGIMEEIVPDQSKLAYALIESESLQGFFLQTLKNSFNAIYFPGQKLRKIKNKIYQKIFFR